MIIIFFSLNNHENLKYTEFVLKEYKRSPEIELLLDFRAIFLWRCKVVVPVWIKLLVRLQVT